MTADKKGSVYAIVAFTMWGFFPFYFKSLEHISPLVILACRIVFSVVLLSVLVILLRQWRKVVSAIRDKRHLFLLSLTAILISINWGCYVWAINNNYVFESSLAYYINPLINVIFGYVFLAERLRIAQWLAVVLAVIGVSIETFAHGQIPWIALTLSVAFGLYGLLHKKMQVDSIAGLSIETMLLMPIALLYLVFLSLAEPANLSSPGLWSLKDGLLLAAAGPVTVVPLLLFTMAAHRISLVSLGFVQYITPTILFLLAALVYEQEYSPLKLLTFVFIWLALIIMGVESLIYRRRRSV